MEGLLIDQEIIKGIVFSQFSSKLGPTPVAWLPPDLDPEIRDIISLKSINILSGEKGAVPTSLAVLPFPSLNYKGLIKCIEIRDKAVRGGAMDNSITVIFEEENDIIFYKYITNFQELFDETAEKITELVETKADTEQITEELGRFRENILETLKHLRDAELSGVEEKAFPKAEDEEVKRDIYRFKIIIVGDPAVGKTSLVLRYTDSAFRRTYLPTIGTNLSEKQIQINNVNISFIFWDIAGQAKFKIMRKHFYSGADGQLLVFDLTRPETFEAVPQWYQDIKSYLIDDLQGFLVGNKSDLGDRRKVNKDEISKLAKKLNLGCIETSALSGENVDEAFHQLAELLISTGRKATD